MPPIPGFASGTYTARSRVAGIDECVNLVPSRVESETSDVQWTLTSTPGRRVFATPGSTGMPTLFAQDGRAFAVVGNTAYELASDGTLTTIGTVATGPEPATISSNGQGGNQLFITSGGEGYIYSLTTGTFTPITAAGFPTYAVMGLFADGYFLALERDAIRFQMSELFDGLLWDPTDAGVRSLGSDNWLAFVNLQRQIWLLGSESSEAWYNSGASPFPFQPVPGAISDFGIEAPFSATELDNTVFWLGRSKDGAAIGIRAQGSSPVRVSTDAVEFAWSQYSRRDDARGYAYQEDGKSFWCLTFPTADATWVFDVATNLWHRRGRWSTAHGRYGMDRAATHCYAFGKHLVGDPETGVIYEQALGIYDDAGHPLRPMRRLPHLRNDGALVFYTRFELLAETGVGNASAPDPQVLLRYSNDGGRTWSDERRASLGATGEYRTRAVWHRLGSARDRVFEVAVSDPVPVVLLNASIDATGGRA